MYGIVVIVTVVLRVTVVMTRLQVRLYLNVSDKEDGGDHSSVT